MAVRRIVCACSDTRRSTPIRQGLPSHAPECFNTAMSFSREIHAPAVVPSLYGWEVKKAVVEHIYAGINAAFERYPDYCVSEPFVMPPNQAYAGQRLHLAGPDGENVALTRPIATETVEDIEIRRVFVTTPDEVKRLYLLGSTGTSKLTVLANEPQHPKMDARVVAAQRKLNRLQFWESPAENISGIFDDLSPQGLQSLVDETMALFTYECKKSEWKQRHDEWLLAAVKAETPIPSVRHAKALGALIQKGTPLVLN